MGPELWAGRAVVALVVLGAVLTLAVNDDGLSLDGLAGSWQLVDVGVLADDPLASVFHLHTQPPLHNLLVGLVGWLPIPMAGTLFLIYAATLLATGLLLHDILVRWGTPPLPAGVLTGLAMVNPALLLTIRVAGYEVPVACLVVAALWAVQAHLLDPTPRRLFLVAGLLTAGVLTRGLLHPVWALALLGVVLLARPVPRRVALAAVAVPVVLVGGWALKNQLVFGQPALASWSGFEVQRGVTGPMAAADVRADVAAGAVSPLARERPWGTLDYYGEDAAGTGPCAPTHDHPSVAEPTKSVPADGIRSANYNHECYLPLYAQARRDALELVRRHPLRYLTTRDSALVLSYDTSPGCFSDPCTWMDRLYQPLLGKLDGRVPMSDWNVPLFEGTDSLDVTLSMTLVVTSAAVGWRGAVAAWRLRVAGVRRRAEWPADEVMWVVAALTVVLVVGGGVLVELGENDRLRAALDPLLLTLPVASALRAFAVARHPGPAPAVLPDRAQREGRTGDTGQTPRVATDDEPARASSSR